MKIKNFAQAIPSDQINIPRASDTAVQTGLSIVTGIIAAVALLMVVISALRMVLARGNPDDFTKARNSVIYSVVGLVIALTAFTIVTFVVENI